MERLLPVCREDTEERSWDASNLLLITGDAYGDHSKTLLGHETWVLRPAPESFKVGRNELVVTLTHWRFTGARSL